MSTIQDIDRELRPFLNEKGQLTALPAKRRKALLAIFYLAETLDAGREYTEAEINDTLDEWMTFRDHATLRRELFELKLIGRTPDGSRYWRTDVSISPDKSMGL